MVCPNCGADAVSVEQDSTVCTSCGYVISENNITSDVAFAEGGDGSSNVIGQFVSDTGGSTSRAIRSISGQRHHREVTLANGRRRIMHLASALKLNATHVDAAFRFFMLAVQHNFTQGRRTPNVVAACLYIVCRRHKTPHMLIDFSDVLQINLFVLGNTFFRLCRTLKISPPLIDPSLYIHRFAAALNLGDQELDIANTALRLVQRMKRDWIQIGRRPAGVCGAALFIAARIHRVAVHQQLIIHTVKIADMTLRRRVVEFRNLPSAQLTFEEFERRNPEYKGNPEDDMTDETSCDPPIYQVHRKKEKLALQQLRFHEQLAPKRSPDDQPSSNTPQNSRNQASSQNGGEAEEDETETETSLDLTSSATGSETGKNTSSKSNAKKRSAEDAAIGAPNAKRSADGFAVPSIPASSLNAKGNSSSARKETAFGDSTERHEMDEAFDEMLEANNAGTDVMDDKETSYGFGVDDQMKDAIDDAESRHLTEMNVKALEKPPMEISSGVGASSTTVLSSVSGGSKQGSSVVDDELEMDASDILDEEVAEYLNSEEETRIKTILWEELNREYLEEQEEKRKEAEKMEAEGRQPQQKRKRGPKGKDGSAAAASSSEPSAPKERSRGINWEAINRANQHRVATGTEKTRHWMEGNEEEQAAAGDDYEDEDMEDLDNINAPPLVRPPPSAFLGTLRPTIPSASAAASQGTTQSTLPYGDDDDEDEDDEEEDLQTHHHNANRRSSTGSRGEDSFDPFFKQRAGADDDEYDVW